MNKDYYKILGVQENVSDTELKKVFRNLAMTYHPDRNPGNTEYEQKFKEINEAYETLKDPEKRKEYDQSRKFTGGFSFSHNGNQGFDPFRDIFEKAGFRHNKSPFDIFDDIDFGFPHSHPTKNPDININYHITLEEAFSGKDAELKFSVPGSNDRRNISLKIPAGIEHGQKLKFQNLGSNKDKRLPPGDLYITILVTPHKLFERKSQNLYFNLKVDAIDAIIGTEVQIPSMDGGELKIKIPAGVQNNSNLRIPAKGMPVRGINSRGDLFVTINIVIPVDLSEETLSYLRNIRKNDQS